MKNILVTYTWIQIAAAAQAFLLRHSTVIDTTAGIVWISEVQNSGFTVL